MTRFSLVIIFFSFLFVRSDGQCSCSDLEFMKQLLQQEIFERKLEISKLRSEIQTSSNGHELIETDSFKGKMFLQYMYLYMQYFYTFYLF